MKVSKGDAPGEVRIQDDSGPGWVTSVFLDGSFRDYGAAEEALRAVSAPSRDETLRAVVAEGRAVAGIPNREPKG